MSLTSAVASAGAYLGGWLPGLGSGSQPENQSKQENLLSLENFKKECLVTLQETLTGECLVDERGEQTIETLSVSGAVTVKAQLPGDTPKVQVKLALPDDFVSFRVNSHCLKPAEGDQAVYRLGNQRFGTATVVPPPAQSFNMIKYTSREDK